ncbi:MAG: hypothetical protein ACTSYA_08015 [Candidatus Kariarchaeaceae archaeon]
MENTNKEIGLFTHKISPDFFFCEGHIGRSDFSHFLSQLPNIDLVYAALPKPETFNLWYRLIGKNKISHSDFIEGLNSIFKVINATEYHIEVGESNKRNILELFDNWNSFPYYYERELFYSAPLNGYSEGLAKCRIPTQIVVFSRKPLIIPDGKYSHEYLDQLMNRNRQINSFDPVIGKGLLARFALKYGHSCYGIDMNSKRLECTCEYVKLNVE